MPNPSLSRAEDKRRWEAYIANKRHRGRTITSLGLKPGTFDSWRNGFVASHGKDGPPPDWFIEPSPPEVIPAPSQKPIVRVKAVTHEAPPDGPIRKVVAIGDLHQKPGRDPTRFKWLGRYVAEKRPDNVVQIGDFGDFGSLSTHDKPGTQKYYERGNFADDLDSCEEGLSLYHGEVGVGEIAHDETLGNHEFRAWRAENESPNLAGSFVLPIEQLFARYRWRTHEYGKFLFLDGVGFVHCPRNIMGREYGGKLSENQIGNDAIFSVVWGHSHKVVIKQVPKIGPSKAISLINLGTAMPQGEVEDYAGLSTTGWSYGVFLLTLQGGRVVGHEFTSMSELESKYA